MKKVWSVSGERYYLDAPAVQQDMLENAVYEVRMDQYKRLYLAKVLDTFKFNYKIYGLEQEFINRFINTYEKSKGNLGALLNGTRGTGKTVTCKIICNALKQPVITITPGLEGSALSFVNSIPQDITIFIDEYEKTVGKSSQILTIMDGAANSEMRRAFLLTTNELRVEQNLLQRPARIRYLKEFKDLTPAVVDEIVEDLLEHNELKNQCVRFISTLDIITVDIVKEVLNEVNMYHEDPEEFADMFNVKKHVKKFKVVVNEEDGTPSLVFDNVNVWPNGTFGEGNVGCFLEINGEYTSAKIKKVLAGDTIVVDFWDADHDAVVKRGVTVKISPSYGTNYGYSFYTFDGAPTPSKKIDKEWQKLFLPPEEKDLKVRLEKAFEEQEELFQG